MSFPPSREWQALKSHSVSRMGFYLPKNLLQLLNQITFSCYILRKPSESVVICTVSRYEIAKRRFHIPYFIESSHYTGILSPVCIRKLFPEEQEIVFNLFNMCPIRLLIDIPKCGFSRDKTLTKTIFPANDICITERLKYAIIFKRQEWERSYIYTFHVGARISTDPKDCTRRVFFDKWEDSLQGFFIDKNRNPFFFVY